jgi:uncharacterized protein
MSEVVINSLWNANIYLDGVSLLGRVEAFKVPQPKLKMMDYKGVGMGAGTEVPVGFMKLESTMKLSSFDYPTIQLMTSVTGRHILVAHGDLQQISAAGETVESALICNMTATFKDPGDINLQAQTNAEIEATLTVYHVELLVNNRRIYLFDALSNQYIVWAASINLLVARTCAGVN